MSTTTFHSPISQELLTALQRLGLTVGQSYIINSYTGEYSLHHRVIHKIQEKPIITKLKRARQRRPYPLDRGAIIKYGKSQETYN